MNTLASYCVDLPKRAARPARDPLAAAFVALLASGCTMGPNFTPPPPPTAVDYRARTTEADTPSRNAPDAQELQLGRNLKGDWWNLFASPAMDQIVSDALTHNRTLQASVATLAQAQEAVAAVAGTRLPQVSANAGSGRQKYGDEFLGGFVNFPPFTYYSFGAAVSYTLDYTGGASRAVEQQLALAELEQHRLQAAYLAVTGKAVLEAVTVAAIRAKIATLQAILTQDRENLKLVQTAYAAGSVALVDVVSAQSQLAADATLLPPLRQDLARAHHALSVVLGQPTAAALPTDLEFSDIRLPREIPVSLPSELAHRRPDILEAEAQLHAATSAVGIAESNLYPKIQLSATLGQQALHARDLFDASSTAWSLIAGLTAPVFDGGTLRAQKRAALDAMHASAANYEQTLLVAFAQVADLLDALDHDAEELEAQSDAQQAAERNLTLARTSYAAGNAGILQVLDAERQYQHAKLGYIDAASQRYVDTVQLFLALGGTPPGAPTVRDGA